MVLRIIMFILFVFSLNACKKTVSGCMDPTSTNYNSTATESDNSCHYLADDFVGSYSVTDTVVAYIPFQPLSTTTYNRWTLSIYKVNATSVKISVLCNGNDLVANVTTPTRLVIGANNCGYSGTLERQTDKSLILNYKQSVGADYYHKGRAVKL
jgi:hypothetical protein